MIMTDINPQVFFAIQVVADVVLCLAVIYILNKVNQDLIKRKSFVETLTGLKRRIEESQQTTAGFLDAMEESKKALREISLSIDEKEARLKLLLERATDRIDELDKTGAGLDKALPGDPHVNVICLAGQGFKPAEIAEDLGLPEGEVSLILELARRRNDSR